MRVALLELTGVNAEEHEFSSVRIGPKFERRGAEFVVVVGFNDHSAFASGCSGFHTSRWRNVERARQVIDDCVNENLHAFLFESGTAE